MTSLPPARPGTRPAGWAGPDREFDRQVATLLERGYGQLSGLGDDRLAGLLEPVRAAVRARAAALTPPARAGAPFLLVLAARLAPPDRTMPLTRWGGRPGFLSDTATDINRFAPVPDAAVPDTDAYAVFEVERGAEFRDVTPTDAVATLTARGRTPLTVPEGIAFLTHHPQALEKNHCFSLAGSRCGDRRVPALWISNGAPRLGWCWAGNPHSWLGLASCSARAAG
jgi:hypothetical protein